MNDNSERFPEWYRDTEAIKHFPDKQLTQITKSLNQQFKHLYNSKEKFTADNLIYLKDDLLIIYTIKELDCDIISQKDSTSPSINLYKKAFANFENVYNQLKDSSLES